MTIFYLCRHKPVVLDGAKAKAIDGCPECGETKRAAVVHDAPRFSASGLAVRGPLVTQVNQ